MDISSIVKKRTQEEVNIEKLNRLKRETYLSSPTIVEKELDSDKKRRLARENTMKEVEEEKKKKNGEDLPTIIRNLLS
jgi:hypothetical protein